MDPRLPRRIGAIDVPQDDVSRASWAWATAQLPTYLLTHSVRSYAWGAVIAAAEGWTFDDRILWTAALFHDVGLTTVPRNRACFEVEGGEVARRFARRQGMAADDADRVARAIVLHMAPVVTLDDGVESVLLDRATGLDVRGVDFALSDTARPAVMRDAPRGAFDRLFLAAVRREVARRRDCQSRRLLEVSDLAGSQARSPWRDA